MLSVLPVDKVRTDPANKTDTDLGIEPIQDNAGNQSPQRSESKGKGIVTEISATMDEQGDTSISSAKLSKLSLRDNLKGSYRKIKGAPGKLKRSRIGSMFYKQDVEGEGSK